MKVHPTQPATTRESAAPESEKLPRIKEAVRLAVLAVILGSPAASHATWYPEERPYPFPHSDVDISSVQGMYPPSKGLEDDPYRYRYEETGEITGPPPEAMDKDEIEIMQEGTTYIAKHFINPTFRKYLKENFNYLLDPLKKVIQNFDNMIYAKRSGAITIKNRSQGNNLKIVIENGRIVEIDGQTLDLDAYDDWDTVVQKINDYTGELDREESDPLNYQAPLEHVEYESYSYFNLDKFFLEYLGLKKGFTPEEKALLENNVEFDQFVERSRKHKDGDGYLTIRPFKLNGKTIIEALSTIEDNFRTLFIFSPDGRIMHTSDEGVTYNIIGPEELYREMYQQILKGDGSDLSSLPSL